MIEIAPKDYWIHCTYAEAILYCFLLEIDNKKGWRLPTSLEGWCLREIVGWYQTKTNEEARARYYIVPVRDI